ncbi:hypothetical protein EDD22DRAFT_1006042 [Suillus occidentalis]|nr:hypothetical protein EDD22DRAFT_1006042 [Suillus occidentalis]
MGSALSHPSLEWILAAGLAGAAAYSYLTYTTAPSSAPSPPAVEKGTKSKKKKQTPKKGGVEKPSEKLPTTTSTTTTTTTAATATSPTTATAVPEPTIVPFPHVIPGEFDAVVPSSDDQQVKKNKATKKTKTKKQKQKQQGKEKEQDQAPEGTPSQPGSGDGDVNVDVSGTSKTQSSESSSPKAGSELRTGEIRTWSFDTDSSWTRIDTRQGARGGKTATGSDDQIHAISADMTSSDVGPSTGDSVIAEHTDEDESPSLDVGDKRRTLAERLLPKPRKTAVDDMLERSDFPGLARVMRVQPRADEAPAPGFSWKDYEDVSGALNDADEEGDGKWGIVKGKGRAKVSRPSTTPAQQAQEAPTKKQRQNAKRNQILKEAKADAEAERQAKLAERRRALEREEIINQSRRGGGKQTSGGMQATVDSRGKLVWD